MAGDQEKPSIIRWAVTAWRDVAAAIQQIPVVLAVGTLVVILVHVSAETFVLPKRTEAGLGRDLLVFILDLIEGFLLVPVAIAVHRFILLGERTAGYRLNPAEPRFRRFFLFTVIIQIVFFIPGMATTLAETVSGGMQPVVVVAVLLLGVYAVVIMVRTLILFPAIAVDAAGAEWSNALRDSNGHAWRMFFMLIAAGVPIIAMAVVSSSLWPDNLGIIGAVIASAGDAVLMTLITVLYAALASRMFAALGERLTGTHGDAIPQS